MGWKKVAAIWKRQDGVSIQFEVEPDFTNKMLILKNDKDGNEKRPDYRVVQPIDDEGPGPRDEYPKDEIPDKETPF